MSTGIYDASGADLVVSPGVVQAAGVVPSAVGVDFAGGQDVAVGPVGIRVWLLSPARDEDRAVGQRACRERVTGMAHVGLHNANIAVEEQRLEVVLAC